MFIKNLLFSVAYFSGAFLGGLAAVSPNGSSPIWPAAGVALAAIFLYGKSVLPGIFIGVFVSQIYSFQDFSNAEKVLDSLIIGGGIAIGSSVQALFGCWLLNVNHVSSSDPLLDDYQIVRFILFGALISTIVAPTVGSTILLLKGVITPANYLLTWGTWWVGDSVGVLIFTPIFLIFLAQPTYYWRQRIITVALPLLVVITLTMLLFVYSKEQHKTSINERFNHQVSVIHDALRVNFHNSVIDSQIMKSFFDNSDSVRENEFYAFAGTLLKRHPYMLALEWIPRVEDAYRNQFERNISSTFLIRELDAGGRLIPAKNRDIYFPVLYVYPQERNQSAFGFDIAYDNKGYKIIEKLQKKNQVLISSPTKLVQDRNSTNKNLSYIIYSPVYEKDNSGRLKGIVANVFRMKEMVESIFPKEMISSIYLEVKDDGHLVFSNYPRPLPHGITHFQLKMELPITIFDKTINVSYLPSLDFIYSQQTWAIWFILLGGFVFTGMSGIGLMMLTGRTLKTEGLIKERTLELAEAKKSLEQQNKVLFDALSKAEEGVKVKDKFLTSMSHELRTPLNAVLGFAQLLEADEQNNLSDEEKTWVEYIISSGRHLLKLISDILDFASLSTGKLSITPGLVDFPSLVNESVLTVKPLMEQNNISYEINCLSTCFIVADATRVKQVVLNLLSNAIKYNHSQGHIAIDLSISMHNRVRLTIKDTGLGIPENKKNEVFQSFNRLGRDSSHSEGTGIGLAICKSLVESMSGRIGFDSKEGVGSRFWIEFDLIDEDMPINN